MFKWLIGLLDRIFAVLGALVFSQIPMFIQQYHQQLTGRVAELKLQMDAISKIAMQSHKSIQQFIQKFLDSGDADFIRQGDLLLWMNERYENLTNALHQLSNSSTIAKPYVFVRDLNWEIAHSTLTNYQPGIPVTLEGIFYALIGIVFGYFLFHLLVNIITSLTHNIKILLNRNLHEHI